MTSWGIVPVLGERNPSDDDASGEVGIGALSFKVSPISLGWGFDKPREDRPCWRSTRAVGSTGCETQSAAPVEFPAGAAVTVFTTINPPTTTPFMTPVIAIIIVVPGAVSDGRGAENAKRYPGSDPATAGGNHGARAICWHRWPI